jgi:hypothetical protein
MHVSLAFRISFFFNIIYWFVRANTLNELSKLMSAKDDEIGRLSRELDQSNANLVNAEKTKSNISTLTELIKGANSKTDAMLRAWNQLERDFDETINALRGADNTRDGNGIIVRSRLNAAKKHWDELAIVAQTIKVQWRL